MVGRKNEQNGKDSETGQNTIAELTNYSKRNDLTKIEKEAIEAYQDVHEQNFQKQDWSFEIPDEWKKKTWCFVINSFCRSLEFRELLTPEESEIIEFYIEHLDRAIQKSRIGKDVWGIRGVFEISWLKNLAIGSIFTEKAFNSFSLDLKTAYKYTNPDNPILFRLKINNKMKALYIDETENEILRPRNRKYKITELSEESEETIAKTADINKETNKQTLVITIEEVEEE